nr:glutathione peroxidase [Botrimarina hoheduenensis]
MTAPSSAESVLNYTMPKLSGGEVNLAQEYAGKVVLVVNVASRCGYTKQYAPLQALHEKYAEQGLAIVGVPCNQFGAQEPGTAAEIADFCQTNYGVGFDMLAKANVNPPEQCALYEELTGTPPYDGKIGWNFEKFLIGRDGKIVGRYKSSVDPMSTELTTVIETELAK